MCFVAVCKQWSIRIDCYLDCYSGQCRGSGENAHANTACPTLATSKPPSTFITPASSQKYTENLQNVRDLRRKIIIG